MNTSFSSKTNLLLIKAAINLLILSAMVITFFSLFLKAHAQMIPQTQLNTIQSFNGFCSSYYKKRQDSNAKQDTKICQQMSASFSSLLIQDAPNGYMFWPVQASLATLAQKGLLIDNQILTLVQTPQAFVNTIRANPDLQALIGGTGNANKNIPKDPSFLPTLWNYTSVIIDQPIIPTCNYISLSYYYSDIWPFVGPEILKETSQQLIQTIDIQKTYNALMVNGHCSLDALFANMHGTVDLNNTYQLEKLILTKVQSRFQGSQIHNVSAGLAWIMHQKNQVLVDDWMSFAVLTNPNALVQNNNSSTPNN